MDSLCDHSLSLSLSLLHRFLKAANLLTGTIPTELAKLPNLQQLQIGMYFQNMILAVFYG
jgi:hypothetical protein